MGSPRAVITLGWFAIHVWRLVPHRRSILDYVTETHRYVEESVALTVV
jgi:hypothetical protein